MESQTHFDRDAIFHNIVHILGDMTSDWETEFSCPIGLDTRLMGDLAFESIDIVQFVVALEQCFQRRDLPFERLLMEDGRYVDEIRVGEVVDFLSRELSGAEAS